MQLTLFPDSLTTAVHKPERGPFLTVGVSFKVISLHFMDHQVNPSQTSKALIFHFKVANVQKE